MKKKALLCLLVCFCMLLCLLPTYSRVKAENEVILLVINNSVIRPLSNSIMPLRINDNIYLPYEMLSHLTTIKYYYNQDLEQIYVFDTQQRLTYDLANNRSYDESGVSYPSTHKHIDGRIYIPFDVVCKKFDIYCALSSYTDIAPLFRINEGALIASDEDFSKQLSTLLKSTYDDYISSGQLDTPIIPAEPDIPVPTKKLGYLTFSGIHIASVKAMSAGTVFFLSSDDIDNSGSLIRHAIAKGHEIGLALDPKSDISLVEQFYDLNEKLRLQACSPAHLVTIQDGADSADLGDIDRLIQCGARLWDSNVSLDISSRSAVEDLAKQIVDLDTTAVISIPASEAAVLLLPAVYDSFTEINLSLLEIEVWTTPINQINDIR